MANQGLFFRFCFDRHYLTGPISDFARFRSIHAKRRKALRKLHFASVALLSLNDKEELESHLIFRIVRKKENKKR